MSTSPVRCTAIRFDTVAFHERGGCFAECSDGGWNIDTKEIVVINSHLLDVELIEVDHTWQEGVTCSYGNVYLKNDTRVEKVTGLNVSSPPVVVNGTR